MKRIHIGLCVVALGWPMASAVAQNPVSLNVRGIPDEIAPGQNTFIEVSGTFPDTCTFGEAELSFAVNVMADNEVQVVYNAPEPDQACGEALTDDLRVFGPIPFEATGSDVTSMAITFDWSRGELTGYGETSVAVTDSPSTVMPETGTWWSPDQPGHGLSIEAQGTQLFIAAYSYDDAGASQWASTQGDVEGGLFSDTWRRFQDGNCWLCGSNYVAPQQQNNDMAAHFAFDGPGAAFLRIGDTPGEALALQRFHLNAAEHLRGFNQTITLPDLSGWWVMVDDGQTDHGPRFENVFEFVPTEEADEEGIAFHSEPAGIAISCYRNYADPLPGMPLNPDAGQITCQYTDGLPGTPPSTWLMDAANVGQDQILLPEGEGVLLRVPTAYSQRLDALSNE